MRNSADLSIALYQPDIPQNAGNLFRTAACWSVPVHVIEPCGFVLSNSRLRRAGMDYIEKLEMTRHQSWDVFQSATRETRKVLLTTKGSKLIGDFEFRPGDTLLLGQESAGVPDDVHAAVDERVALPMASGLRSMNVAVAGAVSLYEALRQLHALPPSNIMSNDE